VILKYVRISLNIMRSTKPPLARAPLDYAKLEGETVAFSAYDGIRLHGMFVPAATDVPRRGLIIFSHEYCSDMHSCARYCRPLCAAGYDVFTFDFRGHGQSDCDAGYAPRQWVTNRELHDIRGAIACVDAWLASRKLPREIGLFGISRGACAAILAAAENDRVAALIADGAFSTDRTIEYLMKRWAYIFATVKFVYENHTPRFWRLLRWTMMQFAQRTFDCAFPSVYKTIQHMRPRPMFFIHGEKDSYLPVEQSRLLYAIAAQPKWMWVAPRARHNQAVVLHPERYAALTRDFFDRYLARRRTTSEPEAAQARAARPPAPLASASSSA